MARKPRGYNDFDRLMRRLIELPKGEMDAAQKKERRAKARNKSKERRR